MYPQALGPIPEETVRVARAACPKGTLAMRLRDVLGAVYQDEQFAKLYPVEGQPAYAPWRLAVVTVLQYVENLSDRQAANAVRERLDWKYALGLELTDPGFHFSVLSEFRTRLVEQEAETLLLERLLEVCKERKWLKAGGKQRTDATHVLARVRSLSNLECVGETLRATLDELAQLAPQWLIKQVSPDWFERYSHRVENYRFPKAESQRTALAQQIGADGLHLLQALSGAEAPAGLKEHASVQVLRQVWQQYYEVSEGQAKWRDGPQARQGEGIIRSPYDPEAQRPHLLVQVHTTVAPVPDGEATAPIQEELAQQSLLPQDQLVDTGYVDAELLVSSQQDDGIRLVGPALTDNSWQARAGQGFDAAHFQLDWQAELATCPQGQHSSRWSVAGERIEVVFAPQVCADCPVRSQCTQSQTTGRVLHLRPQAAHEALQARRAEEQTPAFRQEYATRAGIEGTLSQGVRGMGLRRARYDGLPKTQLQHVLTAVAINLLRIDAVLTGTPRGKTRASPFTRLRSPADLPEALGA
jgi:transposase